MAMSDCIKCWDTPCSCGYEYRNWSLGSRIKLAAAILGVDEEALGISTMRLVRKNHPLYDADKPTEVSEFTKQLIREGK